MGNQFNRRGVKWYENEEGCHICTSHSRDAGGYIRYKVNGKLKKLHKHLFEQTYGEAPEGHVVMHICDTPSCINLEHLKLGTQKENVIDCISKQRKWIPIGECNPRAKLTEAQVKEILKDNRRQIDIARDYEISQAQVSAIKLHKSWAMTYM